jgi:hypothetical protein
MQNQLTYYLSKTKIMCKQIFFYSLILLVIVNSGCKKESNFGSQPVAIQVINGALTTPIMLKMNGKLNLSGVGSNPTSAIQFGDGAFYYSEGKPTQIDIMKRRDTSLLTSSSYDLKNNGIYTLLVAGELPNIQTVLVEETNYPFIKQTKTPTDADSVINIRFVNLCPDVQPLTIRLSGSTTNEVNALTFKGYTPFKAYPAKITDYYGTIGYSILSFDIVENGKVLTTYSMFVYDPNRFKNIALVLVGKKTPSPGQPGLSVNAINYIQ